MTAELNTKMAAISDCDKLRNIIHNLEEQLEQANLEAEALDRVGRELRQRLVQFETLEEVRSFVDKNLK